MRLLHTADWHLGISIGGMSLLEEQQVWSQEIQRMVQRERIDAVLLAGDVYDRAVTGSEAIALYDRTMTALCREQGAAVFMIAGNHDGAARLAALGRLLRPAGLYVQGRLCARPAPVSLGDTDLFLLPYFHPAQVAPLYPEREIRTANDAMYALTDDIRAQRRTGRKIVVLAHCFVTGATLSESDYGAQLGGAAQIEAAAFDGLDYVALGHLHRAQAVTERVRYSGSPYPYSFSETEKSVTVYDTADDSICLLPLHPERTLRTIKGTYEALLDEAEQDLRREDYIKAELTDCSVGLETLETLRALYPRLVSVTGRAVQGAGAQTMSIGELEQLSPAALLRRFCEEVGGITPTKEQQTVFLRALDDARRGGDAQ